MAFPASPTNGQIFGKYMYNNTKDSWETNPYVNNVIKDSGYIKQQELHTRVRAFYSHASSVTHAILRAFLDLTNWNNMVSRIEIYSSLPDTTSQDYGMYIARWGYGQNPDILTKISGCVAPVWGGAVANGTNYAYRDLNIIMPTYKCYVIKVSTVGNVLSNLENPSIDSSVYFY